MSSLTATEGQEVRGRPQPLYFVLASGGGKGVAWLPFKVDHIPLGLSISGVSQRFRSSEVVPFLRKQKVMALSAHLRYGLTLQLRYFSPWGLDLES